MADSIPAFRVWLTDEMDEADAATVLGVDAEEVAREYAERRYSGCNYPKHTKVSVRGTDDVLHRFDVKAERTVSFHAREEVPNAD